MTNAFKQLVETNYADGSYFDPNRKIFYARAPGRLDLMGGIADYSGSLVLEMPIAEAAMAAVQRQDQPLIEIISLGEEREPFVMPLADLGTMSKPLPYTEAVDYFRQSADWAAYIAGAFLVLIHERKVEFKQGAKLLIQSHVPEGKGVSSSAAVEVAAMLAIARAFGIQLDGMELATLCQKVENLVAGAPCGIMDQMTVVHGRPNQLLALRCQPAEIEGFVDIPNDLAIWGIDSGIRHAVSGADYGSVRIGAFMGLKILQQISSHAPKDYLADIRPEDFEEQFADHLPNRLSGQEFLSAYGALPDTVTWVDPEKTYPIFQPTRHPISENARVKQFRRILKGSQPDKGPLLGKLMFESHKSYSACGLGSSGTDLLVELVREFGLEHGLFGAKITGGGSGGTVSVLGRADAISTVLAIAEKYADQTGHTPFLFQGSSRGALSKT